MIAPIHQLNAQRVGMASFYNDKFNGRKTASGKIFDNKKMTCAHRTLPFGSVLEVTNLENDKTVIVTVIDRGPYSKGRILDLSKAAAKKLDFIRSGTTKVRYKVLSGHDDEDEAIDKETNDSLTLGYITNASIYRVEAVVDTVIFIRYGIKLYTFDNAADGYKEATKLAKEYLLSVQVIELKLEKGMLYRVCIGNFETTNEAQKAMLLIRLKHPNCAIVQYGKI